MSVSNYQIVVGIDRSDRTLDICERAHDGHCDHSVISTKPSDLHQWWVGLRERFPGRIAVAFEQPSINLLAFFEGKPVEVFALNPSSTYSYRQSLKVSRARTDSTDASSIAAFVWTHAQELSPHSYGSSEARTLKGLTIARRRLVDQRTALTNRLQDLLKRFFPESIQLMHNDIHRQINLDLLKKWPDPQAFRDADPGEVQAFFFGHGSRSEKRREERLKIHQSIQPLTEDRELILPWVMEVQAIVESVELLNRNILKMQNEIDSLMKKLTLEATLVRELPGAGPVYAPRILAALRLYADNCHSSDDFAALAGAAPVTEKSGKMCKVYRRSRCDHWLRQTFFEWAGESWKHSTWAKAYVRSEQERGKHFNTIVRCLAVKWIRILFRIWRTKEPYDETRYIQSLLSRDHPLKKKLA